LATLNIVTILIVYIFIDTDLYTKSITSQITFDVVDATGVPNGVHVGKYSLSPVFICVEVTVDKEHITNIAILGHHAGLEKKSKLITFWNSSALKRRQ